MSIEETIRTLITEELEKREHSANLSPVSEFCKNHNLSRQTIWRLERAGKINVVRIGRKVFVQKNQLVKN